jgi:hypothetical protein
MKKLITVVTLLSVFSSCASSTVVRSSDPEAKIYIDGQFAGTGTASVSDSKTSFASSTIRIEKTGCREQNYNLPRGQEFEVGPFIGGLFVLVPFLWVSGYKAENTFEYSCAKPTVNAAGTAGTNMR